MVWVIPETGEVFLSYDDYSHRLDYYYQRKFTCELTGHSGLHFFEALASEVSNVLIIFLALWLSFLTCLIQERESSGVDFAFPDPLKGPILRRVQFSTVTRIDHLVDQIHDEFKHVFFPGEVVHVDGSVKGIVREKSEYRFPNEGSKKPELVYCVSINRKFHTETLVSGSHLTRDRKSFSKQVIRTFVKNNVTRESWIGAPWLVKPHIAEKLKIDMEIPAHLRRESKIMERRAQLAQKKEKRGASLLDVLNPPPLPELRPAVKGSKNKQGTTKTKRPPDQENAHDDSHMDDGATGPGHAALDSSAINGSSKAERPVPVKYPIEDLEVSPKRKGPKRPPLKWFSDRSPTDATADDDGLKMESVGWLLETWNTLNVYCQVLKLDSFTFDDYVEALSVYSETMDCELVREIHCALLKLLVDDAGQVQIELPEEVSDPEDEPSDHESDDAERSTPKPSKKIEVQITRRSHVNGLQTTGDGASMGDIEDATHRAAEMLADFDWIKELQKRNFRDGGWEMIVVGVLDRLSAEKRYRAICEAVLAKLAPSSLDSEPMTAELHYANLDINTRARILQILCLLIVDTRAVRAYMDDMSDAMTETRKERVELQRARRVAMEELRLLNEERKMLLPEGSPPVPEPALAENGDTPATDTDMEMEAKDLDHRRSTSTETAEEVEGRALRSRPAPANERKRKRDGEGTLSSTPPRATAKDPKSTRQLLKVMEQMDKKKAKIIYYEKEVAKTDEDLRESDCRRTKCLGRDRFWNRYWFLERNGMPWAGLGDSSTADANYANGCLWVQGPDDIERAGFIELSPDEERRYRKSFRTTLADRKKSQEGGTSLLHARQWGYYDDPESLDLLIAWLDVRGLRELKLRKELLNFREKIVDHMQKRQLFLHPPEPPKTVEHEPPHVTTRMATRTATATGPGGGDGRPRCLRWRNTMAVRELGHLHSDPPKLRKTAKIAAAGSGRVTTRSTRANGQT
ncbi:MAG: hypothetical protein M1826_003907 [Phylliscum demangeonii]|nr:MAG: hypothetical protein M1826_003907 [Phylliscum demangeonii]